MGAAASRESAAPQAASRRRLVNAVRTVQAVASATKPAKPERKGLLDKLGKAASLIRTLGRVAPEPIVGAEWRRKNRLGRAPKVDDEEWRPNDRGAGGARLRVATTTATADEATIDEVSLLSGGDVPPVLLAQRRTALAEAEVRQQQRADAADAARQALTGGQCATTYVKGSGGTGSFVPLWEAYGGPALETLLDDMDMVDARWLCELADGCVPAPRWQAVPHAARIDRSNIWRLKVAWEERNCLPVLVLSYTWLDASHPDKHGLTLQRVAKVLRPMLKAYMHMHTCTHTHTNTYIYTYILIHTYTCAYVVKVLWRTL